MHITEITTGDFIRIRLYARKPLLYKQVVPGGYELVAGEPKKRDRTWDSALLTGGVIDNDPVTGVIRVGVVNQQSADKVYRAVVPYTSISMLHIGVVDIQEVTVPEYLKGQPLQPRIKYERVTL